MGNFKNVNGRLSVILSDPALVWSIYLLCIVEKKAAVTPTLVLDLFEEILAKLNDLKTLEVEETIFISNSVVFPFQLQHLRIDSSTHEELHDKFATLLPTSLQVLQFLSLDLVLDVPQDPLLPIQTKLFAPICSHVTFLHINTPIAKFWSNPLPSFISVKTFVYSFHYDEYDGLEAPLLILNQSLFKLPSDNLTDVAIRYCSWSTISQTSSFVDLSKSKQLKRFWLYGWEWEHRCFVMDLHSSIQVFRVRCRDVGVELMLPVEEEDQDSATITLVWDHLHWPSELLI